MRKRNAMRLMTAYLCSFLLGMLVNMSSPMMPAKGQCQTHATPMSAVDTFREPFKDFFDYEWWLQGSSYAGKGNQYGKWHVVETFWDDGVPRQSFYITKTDPITGDDSARIELDGSRTDMTCFAWRDLWGSPDPEAPEYPEGANPCHLRFRFRLDRWDTTDPDWRVTLGALGGAGPGLSGLEGQVIIGLEGLAPPRLRLHYRVGSSIDDWTVENTRKLVSETRVSLEEVHTLEIMRIADAANGVVTVWLDGDEILDLKITGVDTSFPGGVFTAFLGSDDSEENGFFSGGYSAGSSCAITFDDLIVRNQYIGVDFHSTTRYDLTLDSSPQGKTVRVGNHIVGKTPVTIQVPEGTMPKVGVDPKNFDHWGITPNFDDFSSYSEIWPNITTLLIATVTRAPASSPGGVGPTPTPPIYQDTRITAMCTTGIEHTLNVTSNPEATSFTVDELDYITPWGASLTEGNHTISIPSVYTVGEKRYDFRNWEDDSTNPTRTVNLRSDMHITAYYDATIISEFPTLIACLAVLGVAALVIVLSARKLKPRSISHHHFHTV